MKDLLPTPDAPDVSHQGTLGPALAANGIGSAIGQMATIVLTGQPQAMNASFRVIRPP